MTWSILARDAATGEIGVAVASRFRAAGALCPRVEGGAGAACTQALVNPFLAPDALARLRAGEAPQAALGSLLAEDAGRAARQVHVLAADGRSARHTGEAGSAGAGISTDQRFRSPATCSRGRRCWRRRATPSLPMRACRWPRG